MEIITGNITIKQILEDFFDEFENLHPELLTNTVKENVEKVLSCRNPDKIGFSQYQCPYHPNHIVKVPHSCKSRFCNTCGKIQTDNWISDCHKILPNIDYRHLTLTIPKELRKILWDNRGLLSCLFEGANQMLGSFFKEKSITFAYTMVIHTFGRKLNWNPHLHIIVSCGGLDNGNIWKQQDFIPYNMLSKRWKVKLLHSIEKKLNEMISDAKYESNIDGIVFFCNHILKDLYHKNWYTHLSGEKIDMDHTVGYIGRYSRRPVISEAKILGYNTKQKTVTFEFKDHRDTTQTRWTLSVFKFIQLLIQHIPEKYFHQIRHYGLVANRVSEKFSIILEKLFGKTKQLLEKMSWRIRQMLYKGTDPLVCPKCNSELLLTGMSFYSKKHGKVIFC